MDNFIEYKLHTLSKSKFRSKFNLNKKDKDYYTSKGLDVIMTHADDFIKTRLSDAYPKNDGKQTPMKGHPIFIAQHATATCCRECISKWHKIEKGKILNKSERKYIHEVIQTWLIKRTN